MWPFLAPGWKFLFFFRRNCVLEVGETKKEGEMSTREISVNFDNFWRNFGKRSNFGWNILKENQFVSDYFTDFSPIFWKNWRLAPAADLTAPSFPALIWRLPASPRWSDDLDLVRAPTVILCASDGPNWSWMWSNG